MTRLTTLDRLRLGATVAVAALFAVSIILMVVRPAHAHGDLRLVASNGQAVELPVGSGAAPVVISAGSYQIALGGAPAQHDFVLEPGDGRTLAVVEAQGAEIIELSPGGYRFWCATPGHGLLAFEFIVN